MVILSAQDSDANINTISKIFFKKYPNLNSIISSSAEEIITFLSSVENNITKAHWIYENALTLKEESEIPTEMTELMQLKGVGRNLLMLLYEN